ncbi:ABC transporter ATP-binding protein [Azorhizobium caulinodans ORS 571]|uniref:ABC transporter ATP-binding protein n=1 Tax=Azorhizobium caulinodans (strain ATCC 43989 / DSM 5975 / JCM 20966 / LMG 6465 / NBRC 14845 / NCIMB 13405 / ORS 571) TaxID=438753 RepID=A8IDS8_AZOC5|nr:ABC transporter ATP-binding protein [Azorhizobium caulinodans]BAF88985.1 ABC transporter ATP-binding protein [Azorhizobium caulinodans ORS 571]
MAALSIRDLEVRFPGLAQPALAIPALDLDRGARVAVSGPSGCGKTTLLNVLSGLEKIGHGHVAWADTDLSRLGEGARDRWRAAHVGLVMQDFHLFPGLSALENVLLPQRLGCWRLQPSKRVEALRLLERVGLPNPRQPVETLSRGQMQRVAVARALIARPEILIADEPTASLDAEAGAAVADLLLDLAQEAQATLIVATHDPRLAGRLSRTLRLDAGRLAA